MSIIRTAICSVSSCIVLLTHAGSVVAQEPVLFPHSEQIGGKQGYIDRSGKIVVPLQFEDARPIVNGMARIMLNGKYGFIDSTGRTAIEANFSDAQDFSEDRAFIRIGRAWGLIDKTGKLIVSPQFSSVEAFRQGRAIVRTVDATLRRLRAGAIDRDGRIIIPLAEEQLLSFSDGRAAVRKGKKWGYYSLSGELAIPAEFEHAGQFADGKAFVFVRSPIDSKRLRGVIDVVGKYLSAPHEVPTPGSATPSKHSTNLERCRSFRGDGVGGFSMRNLILPGGPAFIAARDGRKCRLADLTGRPIVKTIFESAGAFNEGFAEVSVNASEFFGPLKRPTRKQFVGLIDRSGVFVVPPIYDRVLMRTVGLVQVSFGGRQGYVDMAGKPITFSQDELDRYVTEWREIFNTRGFIPGRTITAKAADGDYHFYLPAGQCVLDKNVSTDSRIFDEFRARMEAAREFVRKRASEQGEKTTKLNMLQYFQDASGMFAPCSELEAFRTTGDRSRLKTIGSATGSRHGVRDPSANAGIVFMALIVCKAKQGMQALKENAETIDSRNTRIDDAIDRARAGNAVNLPSISMKTLGCVSAILQPASKRDGHSKLDRRISATFASFGVVPDWTLSIERSIDFLETRIELVHQLERESDSLDAIVSFDLRMASQ